MLQPVIKEKNAFNIIGITAKTTNANEMTANAQISKLWDSYFQQQINEIMPVSLDPAVTYGLYSDYASDVNGEYSITIGMETNSELVKRDLVVKAIPAAKYLVFTSEKGPISQIVIKAWQNVWKWFENSEVERAYTGDFEVYDERCADPNEAQVEIYIAIK